MVTQVKNTVRFLKLETSRYVNDVKAGCKTGYRQYKASAPQGPVTDVYVCSKKIGQNVYKNWKGHHNILTGPICIAGVFLPFGTIWAPLALCLIKHLRRS